MPKNKREISSKKILYMKGLNNELSYYSEVSRKPPKNATKIFLFILGGIILAKHKEIVSKNIGWINGDRGYESFIDSSVYEIIHHGSFFVNGGKFRHYNSIFTIFNRLERWKIFFRSLVDFFSFDITHFSYWIEFCFLYQAIAMLSPMAIATPHIQDRHATWLSYYAYENNISFDIYQHGVTPDIDYLPHKIYCTNFYALDEKQVEINRETIILNPSQCVFHKLQFNSVLKFNKLHTSKEFIIGIASQVNPIFINNLLDACSKNNYLSQANIQYVIMLHPLETSNIYVLPENLEIIVEKEKKFINLNILITENSTIIYDYYYSGYTNPIVQICEDRSSDIFSSIHTVHYFAHMIDAIDFIESYYRTTITTS